MAELVAAAAAADGVDDRTKRTIFVGNLSFKTTHGQLRTFFNKFGRVKRVFIIKDQKTLLANRSAFVTFTKVEDAIKMVNIRRGMLRLNGSFLHISKSTVKKVGFVKDGTSRIDDNILVNVDCSLMTPGEMVGRSNDILPIIFNYMDLESLLNAEKVCLNWHQIALKSFSTMKSLEFQPNESHQKQLNIFEFKKLMKRCGPRLESLNATNISRLFDNISVNLIVRHSPNLKRIILNNCNWTNASVEILANSFPELESITLYNCKHITDKGYFHLFGKCQALRTIKMRNDNRFDGMCFSKLGPNVRELYIENCGNMGSQGFQEIAWTCPGLMKISLDSAYLTSQMFVILYSGCQMISRLSLRNTASFISKDHGVALLAALPNLVDLNLSMNVRLLDDDLFLLARYCPKLRILDISDCDKIHDGGIECLRQCIELESINISRLSAVNGSCFEALKVCPLQKVICEECINIKAKSLVTLIKGSCLLVHLDVTGCVLVTMWLQDAAILEVLMNRATTGPMLRIFVYGTGIAKEDGVNHFIHRFLEIDKDRPPKIDW